MYGYSLPKNKHGIIYYEIKFCIPRSNIFTYPNLCVAIGQLDTIPNREKELTITCFLSNMLEKVPKICGNQLLISKKPLNENLPSSGSLGNNILGKHFKGTSDPVSTLQLEFSTKLVDELKKDTNITSTLLKTQLDKIHQIHNSSLYENMNTDLNNSDVKENQSDNVETVIEDCTEASTSRNSRVNCTVTNQEQISRYFKVQKPHCVINKEKRIQEEKQKHITLKEKLLKAKCNESNSVPLQEMDQDIDIEAMAKDNKLHEVKNTVLINWLKKHSVPHKSKGTKAELIKKVLSHLKNTQVLKQYRL
ncbi:uncharacterized protein LOC128872574 [Hylaeus volcanicus]|uniref:uncharacterized protein LOC128872574 n=1 Tax=Hylaeus volcanicus TaxID=313075 RepID=UPI0023B83E13|nr:uncharacterized protein LOC128872574 [Hylaeus volcanicus]